MAGNPILNRMVRHTIYALKHRFGSIVGVYKMTSASTDYKTGVKSAVKTSVDVHKCIVLPTLIDRELEQSISYISGSKSFVSPGGQGWDEGLRNFIFDAQDLPFEYEWEIEDWIVHRNSRYDVKSIEELEFSVGWLITATEVQGGAVEQFYKFNITDNFPLTDSGVTSG